MCNPLEVTTRDGIGILQRCTTPSAGPLSHWELIRLCPFLHSGACRLTSRAHGVKPPARLDPAYWERAEARPINEKSASHALRKTEGRGGSVGEDEEIEWPHKPTAICPWRDAWYTCRANACRLLTWWPSGSNPSPCNLL